MALLDVWLVRYQQGALVQDRPSHGAWLGAGPAQARLVRFQRTKTIGWCMAAARHNVAGPVQFSAASAEHVLAQARRRHDWVR